jgi:protein-tyrosine phosphatase
MFGKNFFCFRVKNSSSNDQISVILPENSERGNLYLGDVLFARNKAAIKMKNIKCVLTVASYLNIVYDDPLVIHKTYELDDVDSSDISQFFDDSYTEIKEGLKNGSVLVHCAAGISRSPSIVIAFLMRENKWTFKKAHDYVKGKRRIINPNSGFIKQLKTFEKQLKL